LLFFSHKLEKDILARQEKQASVARQKKEFDQLEDLIEEEKKIEAEKPKCVQNNFTNFTCFLF
jgi:hypothetical protein